MGWLLVVKMVVIRNVCIWFASVRLSFAGPYRCPGSAGDKDRIMLRYARDQVDCDEDPFCEKEIEVREVKQVVRVLVLMCSMVAVVRRRSCGLQSVQRLKRFATARRPPLRFWKPAVCKRLRAGLTPGSVTLMMAFVVSRGMQTACYCSSC